jgi:hypothetical protein
LKNHRARTIDPTAWIATQIASRAAPKSSIAMAPGGAAPITLWISVANLGDLAIFTKE